MLDGSQPTRRAGNRAGAVHGRTVENVGSPWLRDGSGVPDAMNVLYEWDPASLTGNVVLTTTDPVCGHPSGYQETHNLQLTQAS